MGVQKKLWIHSSQPEVPEHPARGHHTLTEGRRRAGQGAQIVTVLFCNDCPTVQQAFFCSKTSKDMKKLFSRPSLNSVMKGCLVLG